MDFCTIVSGSSGNCTYVGSSAHSLLIDTGLSCKRLGEALASVDRSPDDIDAILITHEHTDHICGLGVFARKYGKPIYATRGTLNYIRNCRQLGVIDASLLHEINEDSDYLVGDLKITPFATSHDAAQSVGYRIENGSKSFAIATDMGCYDDYTVEHLKGLDGILLEANHDVNMLQVGPYPYPLKQRILGEKGHLSNELAGRLLCEVLHDDLKAIMLGHLSAENNYSALALATVLSEITLSDLPYRGEDFDIKVAARYHPGEMKEL